MVVGMDEADILVQCDFEVFGHVQGLCDFQLTKSSSIDNEIDLKKRCWIHEILS